MNPNIPPRGPWLNRTLPPLQRPQNHSPVPHTYPAYPIYPSASANAVYSASPVSCLTQNYSQQRSLSHGSSMMQAHRPIAPAPPRDMPTGVLARVESPPQKQVDSSKGRRAILPSLPGRPAAVPGVVIPFKDVDGKFPCPHCDRSYLYEKHLKCHILRHTGERYRCDLCNDTFSQSDTLKRHFGFCSSRQGNPTGVSHLQHRRAHLEKAQTASTVSKSVPGNISSSVPAFNGTVRITAREEAVNGVAMAPGQHLLDYPMQTVWRVEPWSGGP